jgi:formylglycine-generating enzyme required for sulfatase activity/tRNA A-37 threonylcarbamoyl transferase component Bud32
MPSHSADRNLLFGILALQMDFISRDALIAAMNAWVLDKARTLGEILQERGALRGDRCELLDSLVENHLEMHAGDPRQSLAVAASVHSVRQELQQIADADVQASLAAVGDTPTDDPDATSAHVGPTSLSPHARFQVLRPHAKGGLGEVFVALDCEVKREVALKEIQARHADHPESRARFLLEAEVTGSLEHPGIVPVYGLGCNPDGRPFYAMRFIKGDSLKDAIAAFHAPQAQELQPLGFHSLSFRQLLSRFVAVCNAIAYAHDRGVLHRDLKPANVMLGKYGETLVVDWGLAKVLGKSDVETTEMALAGSSDSGLTLAGRALGTPAYMSPEQAAGRLDQLGPASDVYSLGATFYCLLTGKPPFRETDVGVVLAGVQRGDFKPPRQLDTKVPGALEAVCLKAMALKPEDRYPSPRDLAGEIEHWLADEPVSAYHEPFRVRAGRWARRHPAVVAGSAALVVTTLLATTIGGLLLGREQQAKLAQQRKAREAQVGTLLDAAPQAVPAILEGLAPYRDEIRPSLQEAASKERPANATAEAVRLWRQHRTRAALALLADDPAQRESLTTRLLEEELDPAEMLLVRDVLAAHASELKEDLWQRASTAKPANSFRALVVLAAYDPESLLWKKFAHAALGEMLKANPLHLGSWVAALRPVKRHLMEPLGKVFRGEDEKLKEYRQVAASVLADYAADRQETLIELLLDGDAKQYAVIKPVLLRHGEEAIALLRKELSARPDYWKDPPLDPKWKQPAPELVREIEAAGGIVAERFALCQALSLERVRAVTEGLRGAGYRPVRVRPWAGIGRTGMPDLPRVAIVWSRENRDWKLKSDLAADQVDIESMGMILADVAGYARKGGDRYLAVWQESRRNEEAACYVGVAGTHLQKRFDEFQARHKYLLPLTTQAFVGANGEKRFSSIWGTLPAVAPSWLERVDEEEKIFADRAFAGEYLLMDVDCAPALPKTRQLVWVAGLVAAPRSLTALAMTWHYRDIHYVALTRRTYDSLWRYDTVHESVNLYGLSAEEHLAKCRNLAARGYRPVALALSVLIGEKGPLAASAWHRPVPTTAERDRLDSRQATAAVTLLHLKQSDEVWPILRHSPDPTVRSYLVERLGSRGVDPLVLVQRLEQEKDISARRALIVALGEFSENDLPLTVRALLVKKLLSWYRDDPDAGIHGAIDWLLRHRTEGPLLRRLDWGQAKELESIDNEMAGKPPLVPRQRLEEGVGGRSSSERGRWFVNSQGQTFTQVRGPVSFRMGSLPWEPDRGRAETPHRRVIPRSFAIMTKPVTVAQWQQFLKDRPNVPRDFEKRFSPELGCPINSVSWFAAAQYCNWLSDKEAIPREQWCYLESSQTGINVYPDHLRRTGYRLPTEAEWEYACRAETTSSRYYGSSEELLPRYCLFVRNSQDRTWAVGQKRPNDFGLFDMHGNAWTWCQDAAMFPVGQIEDNEDMSPINFRSYRGGAFDHRGVNVRSADRTGSGTSVRFHNLGVRVARTCR